MGCFCFFSALVFVLGALRGCECQTIDSATISSGTIFLDDKGDEVHMHGLGALPPGSHPQEDDASGRPKYYFVGSTAKRQHFGADGSVFWLLAQPRRELVLDVRPDGLAPGRHGL